MSDGWNELGSTLNGAAKVGARKAGKWFEIGKLHMKLANSELNLKDIYEKIGEEIYKGRVLDVDASPRVRELLAKASREEAKIRKLQEKIRQMESERTCVSCFKKLEEHDRYCPYCSAPQPDQMKERY